MNQNRNHLNENEKEVIKNHVTTSYNNSEEYPAPLTASSFISDQNQNTGAGSRHDEAARTFMEATRTPASAEIRFSDALTAQSAEGRRIAANLVEQDIERITALVSSQLPGVDRAAIEREVRNQVTTAYTGTGQYLGGVLVMRGQEDSYEESIENGAELANAVEEQAAEDANSGLEAESGPEGEVDLGFYYPESNDDQNSDSNDSGMGEEEVSDSSQDSGSEEEQISDSFEDNGSQEADNGSSDPANDSSDYGSSDSGDSPTSSDYHADESTNEQGYDSDQSEQCSTNAESVSDGEQSGTGAFSDPKEGSEDKAHVIESDQSNQSTRKRKFDGEEDDYPNPKRQRKSDSDDDNNGKGGPGTGSSGGGPSVSGPEDSGPGDSVGGTDNGISNKSLFKDISLFFYGKERDENFLSPVDFVIEIEQEE